MFAEIEGGCAVLVSGGVYKQVPIYERAGGLYARYNGGYVRLYANGSTSRDKLRLDVIDTDATLRVDSFGKLYVTDGPNRKPIDTTAALRLSLVAE